MTESNASVNIFNLNNVVSNQLEKSMNLIQSIMINGEKKQKPVYIEPFVISNMKWIADERWFNFEVYQKEYFDKSSKNKHTPTSFAPEAPIDQSYPRCVGSKGKRKRKKKIKQYTDYAPHTVENIKQLVKILLSMHGIMASMARIYVTKTEKKIDVSVGDVTNSTYNEVYYPVVNFIYPSNPNNSMTYIFSRSKFNELYSLVRK